MLISRGKLCRVPHLDNAQKATNDFWENENWALSEMSFLIEYKYIFQYKVVSLESIYILTKKVESAICIYIYLHMYAYMSLCLHVFM